MEKSARGGRAGMVPPLEEREDGDRVSFPRYVQAENATWFLIDLQNSFLKSRKWGQQKVLKSRRGTCRFECDTLVPRRRIL